MSKYIGDFVAGSVIKIKFNTRTLAQAPITFAGTPQVAVYKDSVTETTTGITQPSVDYDSVTGLHYMVVDTADAFYATGKDYDIVVTAGTVDGQSVVGETIRTFSIENRNTKANVTQLNGNSTAAAVLKLFADILDQSTGQLDNGSFAAGAIDAAAIANGAIDAATFAADVDAEILSYLVDDATRIDASALNTASGTTIPAIVADTNELQTDLANGGRLDLLIDAILADTNEIQTDLANGGRLDLLIDAILEDTGTTIPATITTIDNEIGVIDGIVDDILVDTGTTLPATLATLATAANLATVAGYLDTEITAILEDTGTTLPAQIAALNNLSSANVLTQVNAALDTAIAELSAGVPTATPTTRTALMLLYMALRNRTTTTATAQTIQNDAGTTIATATLSDDGTTMTKAEFA